MPQSKKDGNVIVILLTCLFLVERGGLAPTLYLFASPQQMELGERWFVALSRATFWSRDQDVLNTFPSSWNGRDEHEDRVASENMQIVLPLPKGLFDAKIVMLAPGRCQKVPGVVQRVKY